MAVAPVPVMPAMPMIVPVPMLVSLIGNIMMVFIMAVMRPDKGRRVAIHDARAGIINNAWRRDVTVVVANDVIHIACIVRDVIAQPLTHDHPASIGLKTGLTICFLHA